MILYITPANLYITAARWFGYLVGETTHILS